MINKETKHYIKLFGTRTRKLRNDKGWSLKGLSFATGLGISVLSDIENGKKEISFSNKLKLYRGLGVTEYEFHDTPELRAITGAPATKHQRLCPMAECKMLCFDCDTKEDNTGGGEKV